ncbi:phage holin family protein [Pseudonocardia sp. CA-107938]|uniref:phage holin family protein n=1 Tax=Pseudonocardia sp. CA-107938 TaxID=3240021 RepID=UPI003D90B768
MTSHTHDRATGPAQGAESDLSGASISELVSRLTTQLSELMRGELELAKAELAEKGKQAGAGAGMAGAGAVLGWFGVGALVTAAIAGLAVVLPVWLSALIVAAVLLIVAGVLALVARSRIAQAAPPTPEQAIAGLQRDVETVKEAARR